ncbi:MAG TPA: tetratricopeptide repeat protein [Ktedonobacterales bacterium]|nr:tetratricopeptide repeat protein [Ktedonobacterales bacterium]
MALSAAEIAGRYTASLRALGEIAEAYYFAGALDDARQLWQVGAQTLTGKEVPPADRVNFLLGYGGFLVNSYFLTSHDGGMMHTVVRQAQQEAAALGDEFAIARSLFLVGQMMYHHNLVDGDSDFTQPLDYLQRSSALREKIGDEYNLAESLFYTGLSHERQGHAEQAEQYYRRALELAERRGNRWAASEAHRHLTDHTEGEQRFTHALRSLGLRQEMSFTRGLPPALLLLGKIAVTQDKLALALKYCQQGEQLAEAMNLPLYLVTALLIRSDIAAKQGKPDEASEYVERAASMAQQTNHALGLAMANEKRAQLANAPAGEGTRGESNG